MVTFEKEKQQEQVLQEKHKLKRTKISIDEDFSAKLLVERRLFDCEQGACTRQKGTSVV